MRLSRPLATLLFLLISSRSLQAGFALPGDLQPGEQFQIIFVTSGTIQATSGSISTYNDFVTNQALSITSDLDSLGYSNVTWSAIASTNSTSAISNAPQLADVFNTQGQLASSLSGVGLYTMNGNQVLNNSLNYDQNGNSLISYVWTGSYYDGSIYSGGALGDSQVITARSDYTSLNWINSSDSANTASLPLYGLSDVLTVPPNVITTPAPSSLTLLCSGIICIAVYFWRQRIGSFVIAYR